MTQRAHVPAILRHTKLNFRDTLVSLCADIGSDFTLKCALCIRMGLDDTLLSFDVKPGDYTCPSAFRDDYAIAQLIKKYPGWNTSVDRRMTARLKFLASEDACVQTNARISTLGAVSLTSDLTPHAILYGAREKIRGLLGHFSWYEARKHFSMGSRANVGHTRAKGDPVYKFGSKPTVTSNCLALAYSEVSSSPLWLNAILESEGVSLDDYKMMSTLDRIDTLFNVSPGCRIDYVPKNAKTDRTIAVEPVFNSYAQRGIGHVLRSRLLRAGIDLREQGNNQRAASEAVAKGYATVDLSAASDSVSLELVRWLMPPDWFSALCECRSPNVVLEDGEIKALAKISSMGNGYTFELESLIFWALARTVSDRLGGGDVWVYGDDIIIKNTHVPTLGFVLEYTGFSFNYEKSYWSGVFRESCGKHYFNGTDVSPFHMGSIPERHGDAILLANQLRRWSRMVWGLDGRFKRTYDLIVSSLPESLRRPLIPDGIGDQALFGDFDEVNPSFCPSRQSYVVRGLWVPIVKPTISVSVDASVKMRISLSSFLCKSLSNKREQEAFRPRKWDEVVVPSGFIRNAQDVKWRSVDIIVSSSFPSYGPWFAP